LGLACPERSPVFESSILPRRISIGWRIYDSLLCDPLPRALGQPSMLSTREVLLPQSAECWRGHTNCIGRQSSVARHRHLSLAICLLACYEVILRVQHRIMAALLKSPHPSIKEVRRRLASPTKTTLTRGWTVAAAAPGRLYTRRSSSRSVKRPASESRPAIASGRSVSRATWYLEE
jgi:hypothetical protein